MAAGGGVGWGLQMNANAVCMCCGWVLRQSWGPRAEMAAAAGCVGAAAGAASGVGGGQDSGGCGGGKVLPTQRVVDVFFGAVRRDTRSDQRATHLEHGASTQAEGLVLRQALDGQDGAVPHPQHGIAAAVGGIVVHLRVGRRNPVRQAKDGDLQLCRCM